MRKLGNPFVNGTLGSLILLSLLTGYCVYAYLTREPRDSIFLLMIVVGLVSLARSYFRYRQLQLQHGVELLDKEE